MKDHLRVDYSDLDEAITEYQRGSVGLIDGWGGILGRCIMPQTWAIDVVGKGPHLLPFPDATNIVGTGNNVVQSVTFTREGGGICVMVDNVADDAPVTITATYGMPDGILSAAQSLIKLMVSVQFDAMKGADNNAFSTSIENMINLLRVHKL
ncbi:MAG: head-tail connector protein [Ahrensia sp.]|nr:head-tail connector protein [Ahrensia sp.]